MKFEGRHAVVTGASRGIGLAIAERLAQEGARVSAISRSSPPAELRAFRATADVADEEAVTAALARCREVNGPIGILVNCAGIAESAPLRRTTSELWERILATNLTGTFVCTRDAAPDMIAAGFGRIVNVASTAGLMGGPYLAAYCASKHGVIGFTRAVAAELANSGVTVNALCPGYTHTEILDRAIENIVTRAKKTEIEARDLLARENPEGRFASVDEVAQAAVDLIAGSQTGIALIVPGLATA